MRFCHPKAIAVQFFSVSGAQVVEGHAPTGTDARDDIIVVAGVKVELFDFIIGLSLFDTLDVGSKGGDIPLAGMAVERVGGRSATKVFLACPVAGIVTRVQLWQAEVGYFVMLISGTGQFVYQSLEESETQVLVCFFHLLFFP